METPPIIEEYNLTKIIHLSENVSSETLQACTVTVTIEWVNEYGVTVGYSSGTATVDGPLSCAFARAQAEDKANQGMPQ